MNHDRPSERPPEGELSEEQLDAQELACCRLFVENWVMTQPGFTGAQKAFVVNYLATHAGTWRQFNDDDIYVSKEEVTDQGWRIVFASEIEGYGIQDTVEIIPLA